MIAHCALTSYSLESMTVDFQSVLGMCSVLMVQSEQHVIYYRLMSGGGGGAGQGRPG